MFYCCFYSRSARTGEDIREIRSILDTSLSNVARDPNLDSILLEQEAKKLDESLGKRWFYSVTRLIIHTVIPKVIVIQLLLSY